MPYSFLEGPYGSTTLVEDLQLGTKRDAWLLKPGRELVYWPISYGSYIGSGQNLV